MTREETVAHWLKGSSDAVEVARLAHGAGKYALTLFNCHLAVEKALKAAFIAEHDREPPPTHNLGMIAGQLTSIRISDDDRTALAELTDYAVAARYDDPNWAERQATEEATQQWLARTEQLLTLLQP
ncbi:MAG: HEPN domain-containing protein [Candidatus Peregrinibacteria bacterium Greene0416_19]|nr:MAG: HEPN domain-containing protein [Candidatus Peregrinibacteria bacterium Greene0416_19]